MLNGFRVVFIGAVECSRHCLLEVLKWGVKPVAIFTLPPERAELHSDYADLSDIGAEYPIPLHRVEDINIPMNGGLIQNRGATAGMEYAEAFMLVREIC